MLKAVEEFATECSFIKIFASEMLDYVVDEGVQIHGGYGYHQDYAVERAYRDSRINRIFEGTNEINRLLATGMLLKRAQRGQLPLVEAVKKLQAEILAGPSLGTAAMRTRKLVANAKKIALFALGVAYQKYMDGARRAAGGAGRHHRHRDERLRHGIGAVCARKSWPSYSKGEIAADDVRRCFCARRWRRSKAPRAPCWRPAPKAMRCAPIWRC